MDSLLPLGVPLDPVLDDRVDLTDLLFDRAVVVKHAACAEERVLTTQEAELHHSGMAVVVHEDVVLGRQLEGAVDASLEWNTVGFHEESEVHVVADDRLGDLSDLGVGFLDGGGDGDRHCSGLVDEAFELLLREILRQTGGSADVVTHGDSLQK